ncbi:MAG: class I SAM-dependent methyltransferase [Anaerolineae bacterium]|nr:class I SAM-dependent methyltransferase [Anaerolineae bacterium]MDW8170869.1 class I SAM-dependent methyltransferase [Anaerolineae bacterium]
MKRPKLQRRPDAPPGQAIRQRYQAQGVERFYAQEGAHYRNPHEAIVARAIQDAVIRWSLPHAHVLDLACGSGEATLALWAIAPQSQILGVDPYTSQAYRARTGQDALPYTFQQVAQGALADQRFDLIVCSFALHLADVSWLPSLCLGLAQLAPHLLVITPHKRPLLRESWGWALLDEHITERVRARAYRATLS